MSLICDKFFNLALTRSTAVTQMVGREIYNTYRPEREERADKIPYIIIQYKSLLNANSTKDSMEGDTDNVVIHILCVAVNRDRLGELTEAVRQAVIDAYNGGVAEEDCGFCLDDYQFGADEVIADPTKPCVYQTLTYNCQTSKID